VNLIERVLREHATELGLAELGLGRELATAVLTPRYTTSRHVVGLVWGTGREPRVVVKIPRRPGDNAGVRQEAAILGRLADAAGRPLAGAPRLLGLIEQDGHDVLVETVVRGTPLDSDAVRRDRDAAVSAGVGFVSSLPVTRAAADNGDWYDRVVGRPLRDLVDLVPGDPELRRLAEHTHAFLEPLRQVAVPAVVEHADLSHPNLFLDDAGVLQVIDWERSTLDGMPGHDLVFYLGYLGEAGRLAFTPAQKRQAFDATFVGPGAWARPVLRAHLEHRGLAAALLPQVVLATWARSAATLVARLVPEDGGAPAAQEHRPTPAQLATAVAQDRDVLLWRHAVERSAAL
jgi:hypothetical protein